MNKPTRILIVEDLLSDAELAKHAIRKGLKDCEFEVVETQADFLNALETFQPDVILSDYSLPQFDGMNALKLALKHAPLTPLIIWTGSISEDVAVECMKAGANNYVLKENLKRLAPAVIHALEERQLLLERKQAQETLQKNEKRFRALIENGLDDISLLDVDGTLLWESPSIVRNLGYPPDVFVDHNIFELIHPDDQEWTQNIYQKLAQEVGGREQGTFRLRHSDGTWRWVEGIATNMLNEPGVNAIVINYRDITERKQAEEALRESQAKYQNLVETSHDLIWSIDAEGRFTFVNRAAKEIYGYEPEELLGRSFFEILDPQYYHQEGFEKFKEAIAKADEFKEVETYVRHRDGRQIILSTNSIVARDTDDNVISVAGSSHDITIRKRVEDVLKEERNLLRTLIDNIPDRIYAMDTQGRKTLSNTADWMASGGKAMEDVIGKTDFDTYPPELAEEFWQLDKAVLDSGQPMINFEEPGLDSQGNPVSILTTKIPLHDDERKVIGLVGIGRNITERKQAELERQALLEIMQGLANTKDLQELLKLVHLSVAKVIYAENFFVVLYQESDGLFEEIYSVDQYDPPAPPSKLERSITSYVFRSGESLLLTQERFDELVAQGEVELVGTNSPSWLGVPLRTSGKTIGVIAVQDYENPNRYSEHDQDFLSSIATQVALAIERQRAEEALRASEERFRRYFELGLIGMTITSPTKGFIEVNDKICAILAYERDELLQMTWPELTHPDDLAADVAQFNRVLSGEINSYSLDKRFIRKDGKVVDTTISVTCVRRPDHSVDYIVALMEDITERKQAEDNLYKSEALYRQAMEVAGAVPYYESYYDEGRSIKYEFIGEGIRQITGYGPEEFSATLWDSLVEEIKLVEDLAGYSLDEGIQRVRTGENPIWKCEHRIRDRDGKIHWVFEAAVELRDENGVSRGSIGTYQDITERKRAETAEREQRALAEALLDTAETLSSTLDYGEVLDHILAAVGRVVPHDAATVMLIKGDSAQVVRSYGYDKRGFDFEIMGVELPLAETNNLRQMLETRQAVVVYDTPSYPGWKRLEATDWLRSSVGAPISVQGKVVGFILLDSQTPGFFTPVHAERLGAFANQAALAIHNADLLQQAQEEIAERKQAEAELRASEERFRQLADNIQEAFWITNADSGEEIYLSPAAETIWGRSIEELSSKPNAFIENILPEDQPRLVEALEKQRMGEKVEIEYRIMKPDGSLSWIWDRAFPIFDDSGRVKRVAGITADITERRESEIALVKSESRYRELFDSSPISIWEEDFSLVKKRIDLLLENGITNLKEYLSTHPDEVIELASLARINDANNAAMELYQTERKDVTLKGVLQVLSQDALSHFQEEILGFMSPLKRFMWEGTDKTADGRQIEVIVNGAIPHGYEEDWSKVIVSLSDITERKKNEIEISRRVAEMEALYENGLAVGRLLEPQDIGERIIETFAHYLSWHHVTIRLKHPESDELKLIAFNQPGLSNEEKNKIEHYYKAMIGKVGQGMSGWVIQTGMPIRTGNVHTHPQYIDTHEGIQSGLYMPLKVGERVIGAISVESEAPDVFTEQDERLLATLANQAAIAFENARLYQEIEQELLERKRAEEALRVSETHYRELADSITDIMFELDQELHYTHWNKASEALTGILARDAIGKSMPEIFGESEEQTRIGQIYEGVLKTHQPITFETTLRLNGQKHPFEINAYPSTRGVSVVAKDVTDRKRSETIMQKRFELIEYSAHHTLSELMQTTTDEVSELTGSSIGFFHFVNDDQITLGMQTWSTNTLQVFRVPASEGTHLPLDQAGVWAEAARQRRPVIQNDYESLSKRRGLPQGHVLITREIVIPIIRNERIMAIMGIANKPQDYTQHDLEIAERLADYAWDITERKQMEVALEAERNQLAQRVDERTADLSRANSNLARALRVKDEFLANMSHELRTPLNAILGLSESLAEQIAGPLNEKQQKYIATIGESGHHLLSLINDILDLAKIEAGQITLDINKVDIHSVCQASLRMIKQLAQKKNQEVSLEIDDGLGLMWADERRLKQMIVNLLGNAVKFTPENGKLGLEVHGDEEANKIGITVWDNGIGIKEGDLARLFQPFVQLDSGLARETTGTGLGLALVAQMARLHGGGINAFSDPDKGSRFTIVLPWEPALAMDAAARMKITGKFRAIKPNETNKPTILLVEDTKEVVMMLKDYLELTGYKVVTAQDGVDAIVQAKLVRPDLILMDIQMPRMDGLEATRKLRSEPDFKYTPIIALTALAMPSDRERCLEAGMDEYISKPVNLKALIKIIQSCLFNDTEVKSQ